MSGAPSPRLASSGGRGRGIRLEAGRRRDCRSRLEAVRARGCRTRLGGIDRRALRARPVGVAAPLWGAGIRLHIAPSATFRRVESGSPAALVFVVGDAGTSPAQRLTEDARRRGVTSPAELPCSDEIGSAKLYEAVPGFPPMSRIPALRSTFPPLWVGRDGRGSLLTGGVRCVEGSRSSRGGMSRSGENAIRSLRAIGAQNHRRAVPAGHPRKFRNETTGSPRRPAFQFRHETTGSPRR